MRRGEKKQKKKTGKGPIPEHKQKFGTKWQPRLRSKVINGDDI